jgi:hypothetical protein
MKSSKPSEWNLRDSSRPSCMIGNVWSRLMVCQALAPSLATPKGSRRPTSHRRCRSALHAGASDLARYSQAARRPVCSLPPVMIAKRATDLIRQGHKPSDPNGAIVAAVISPGRPFGMIRPCPPSSDKLAEVRPSKALAASNKNCDRRNRASMLDG